MKLLLTSLYKKLKIKNLQKIPDKLKTKKIVFKFIWEILPISLILTLITSLLAASWLYNITGLEVVVKEKLTLLPFVNEKIILVTEYSLRGLFTTVWFVLSLHEVKERHLMVFRIFKQRIPFPFLYMNEGIKGSIIPRPILDGVQETIVEFTLGIIPGQDKKYESISCQTLDDQEVILEYAVQGRTFDPFLWKNVENPQESIKNKLLSQLRIIVALLKEKEVNTLKGAIAGMLLGKEYLIWRNPEGNLLRNSGGMVLAVPSDEKSIKKILSTPSDKITKECLKQYLLSLKTGDEENDGFSKSKSDGSIEIYSIETIPSVTFDLDAVWLEAKRVGAHIEPPALRDITPPKKVREAAEEKRIEELQGDAREEENIRHSKIALKTLGLSENTIVAELNDIQYRRWKELKDDPMIQEKKITKVVVGSSGGNSAGSDFADKMITAATISNRS